MKPITFYVTRTSINTPLDKPIPEAYRNPATRNDDWSDDEFHEYEYKCKAWLVDIYPNQIHTFIKKHQGCAGVIFNSDMDNFPTGQEFTAIEIYDTIRGW